MKSHKKKRTLMLLMTLTLATSCVVGATYAKYSSAGGGGDEALIAKFGVSIAGKGQAFQTGYDENALSEHQGRASVKSVLSMGNVIAPGTRGDMVAMQISGRPEVSVQVDFRGEFAIANWEVKTENGDSLYYCPLTITVGDQDFHGLSYQSAEEFQAAVNEAIGSFSGRYDAEVFTQMPIEKVVSVPSVSWRWDFEEKDHDYTFYDKSIKDHIDEYDTFLANRACEKPGEVNDKVAGVVLIVTATVTQID